MRLRLVGATWLLASVLGCDSAPPATAAQQAERFVAALNADSVDAARATWSTSRSSAWMCANGRSRPST